MGQYRKRVHGTLQVTGADIHNAFKFDGTLSCWKEIQSAFPDIKTGGISYNEATNEIYVLNILNADGDHSVSAGDYIVSDNKGGYFPCKPDGFHKTFEQVDESANKPKAKFDIDPIFSLL